MLKRVPKDSKLLVISDTGMFEEVGHVFAFGPVLRELEYLAHYFKTITWIGFNKPNQSHNRSYQKITHQHIRTIFLKSTEGPNITDKLDILTQYPKMYSIINNELKKHNYIHVRAPSNPALIAMHLSKKYKDKQFWFKYAGSWVDSTSYTYNYQRNLLKKLKAPTKVTVNGQWPNQEKHILAFENPCLTSDDRVLGEAMVSEKIFQAKPNYCFIGNLNANKGVSPLLKAFAGIERSAYDTIHVVGDGKLKDQLVAITKLYQLNVVFHGTLQKSEVINIYKTSQFITLPSKSEGFPKVISEALNYGCIPLVTKISCIDQYVVDDKNGFLIASQEVNHIKDTIQRSLKLTDEKYDTMIRTNHAMAKKFTYGYYVERIMNSIYDF
ncbi:glycosyltransferase [uncultured Psychroserpens sp.]|uniref:glycosyltransferase n=1 Tax=uncultured Psychroserpens sp. TaxID=255436 RepID=UPI0026041F1A|nr:glycosyltransferase [uncultured Psychroserpens sp.]